MPSEHRHWVHKLALDMWCRRGEHDLPLALPSCLRNSEQVNLSSFHNVSSKINITFSENTKRKTEMYKKRDQYLRVVCLMSSKLLSRQPCQKMSWLNKCQERSLSQTSPHSISRFQYFRLFLVVEVGTSAACVVTRGFRAKMACNRRHNGLSFCNRPPLPAFSCSPPKKKRI